MVCNITAKFVGNTEKQDMGEYKWLATGRFERPVGCERVFLSLMDDGDGGGDFYRLYSLVWISLNLYSYL